MTCLRIFDPARHETLKQVAWSENRVREEIIHIVNDIVESQLVNGGWPLHPLDAESYPNDKPKWALYAGAAGVLTALNILKRYQYHTRDYNDQFPTIYQSYLASPDVKIEPGLQLGDIGILTPWLISDLENVELADLLAERMRDTLPLPYYDITSGQSGMMHTALALYRLTNDNTWRHLYRQGADILLKNCLLDKSTEQWLWQSEVFGFSRKYYGACHGLAGNTNILLQGRDLLEPSLVDEILERSVTTLERAVIWENAYCNWPNYQSPNPEKYLLQWCHGASGIITAMASALRFNSTFAERLEKLLYSAGELIWLAGPLKKGVGICHGTAGNGYAFLSLYKYSDQSQWLDRARQFAVHSIEQCIEAREHYGQGRYSLWTGDAGLAIYLHHCLYPELTALPGLDIFS